MATERQRLMLNTRDRPRDSTHSSDRHAARILPPITQRSVWMTIASCVVATTACGSSDPETAPLSSPESVLPPTSQLDVPDSTSSPTSAPVRDSISERSQTSVVATFPGTVAATTTPAGDGQVPRITDALRASCGMVELGAAPADLSALPPLGERAEEVGMQRIEGPAPETGGEVTFLHGYTWWIASETDTELGVIGQAPEGTSIDLPFGYVSFTRGQSGWQPVGWGQCRIDVGVSGWGNAQFVLAAEPSPASTTVSLLATERACASAEPPTDREIRSVVLEDASSVSVVILVEPPTGAQTCPANPSFPVVVDLGAPLAGRTLIDASVQPGLPQTWPPATTTIASVVSLD